MHSAKPLLVEVSAGELLDKLTILEIKSARVHEPAKLANVQKELDILAAVCRDHNLAESAEVGRLIAQLKSVNEELWDAEDRLRHHERAGDFGERFIELARSVYHFNDRRSAIKRTLNQLLSSSLMEEKSYGESRAGDQEG